MSLTRAEIALLVEEISPAIHQATIQRVLEIDPRTFVLRLRRPGENLFLLVSTSPNLTRLHFVTSRERQPEHPSHFTMLLRKWLDGSIIEDCHHHKDDRIIEIKARIVDPAWIPSEDFQGPAPRTTAYLLLELTGNLANVYLLDKNRIIRGTQAGNTRGLRIGSAYELPSPLTAPTSTNHTRQPEKKPVAERVRWQLDKLPSHTHERSLQVEKAYTERSQTELFDRHAQELRTRLRQRARTLTKRIENIEKDLKKVENADQYRRWGELLQAAFREIPRGASSAWVTDYYQEDMPQIEIPLDPARPLQHNIARYFHQYRRFKDAAGKIEDRLLESMDALEKITAVQLQLDACDSPEALNQLADELRQSRLLPPARPQASQARGAQAASPRQPYREFRARSGATILVGRGARHNDTLTTRIARGRDIWMHARDWTGAHVLLRMENSQPPRSEDLLDAATLAAYFSRGKNDSIIDVTYAEAKHVRKPRGAAPGQVTIAGGATLAIALDPERLARLLEQEVL